MIGAYSLSFLLIFLLAGQVKDRGFETGFRITPGPVSPMPHDPTRLAPWAADYNSRMQGSGSAAGLALPDPAEYSSQLYMASSEPSTSDLKRENDDLRQRLEQLEQLIKGAVSQPPVPAAPAQQPAGDKKAVPGWTVEMYPWNSKGTLSPDPKRRMLTHNCEFNGSFGQASPSELNIYRFLGTFRARESGRYVFAADLVCGFDHDCGFQIFLNDQPIGDFHGRTDGNRVVAGIPLTPGDHRLEFRTWLSNSSFIKMDARNEHRWTITAKAPSDFDQRALREDELFSVIPSSLNAGSRTCAMN